MRYKRKPEYVIAYKWMGYTAGGLTTFIKNHDLGRYNLVLGSFGGETGIIFDMMGVPVVCPRGSWLVLGKDGELRTLSNKQFTTYYMKTVNRGKEL